MERNEELHGARRRRQNTHWGWRRELGAPGTPRRTSRLGAQLWLRNRATLPTRVASTFERSAIAPARARTARSRTTRRYVWRRGGGVGDGVALGAAGDGRSNDAPPACAAAAVAAAASRRDASRVRTSSPAYCGARRGVWSVS